MAEVTQDMILDYITRKGGVVRNVDLVRHFKKYLQIESAQEKDRARVIFKERVNRVAYIRADSKQEKYLHLRSEFYPAAGLTRPPTGRTFSGSDHSSEDPGTRQSDARFSLSSVTSDLASLKSPGAENDLVFNSFTAKTSPPPVTTAAAPPQRAPPTTTAHQQAAPTEATPSSLTNHQATPASAKMDTSKLGGLGSDDFGLSLMAELDSFGSILDSFGVSKSTSSASSASSTSKLPPSGSSASSVSGYSGAGTTTHPTPSSYSSYASSTSSYPKSASSAANSAANPSPQQPPTVNPAPQTAAATPQSPSGNSTVIKTSYGSPFNSTPQKPPTTSPQKNHTPSPQKVSSNGPPRKQSGKSVDMDFDLNILSSLSSAKSNVKKSSNAESNRRPSGPASNDMDLTNVLLSLESAKTAKPVKTRATAPKKSEVGNSMGNSLVGGAGRADIPKVQPVQNGGQQPSYQASSQSQLQTGLQNRSDQPKAQPSYQNSTRFDQPKVQPSYQNSTRFDQPKVQPSYQNSTRFDQPTAQPSYQNSTRFDQPKVQPSYQNSTRFDQPKLQPSYQNSTRFDQPKLQPSFQNSTWFDQPKAPPSSQHSFEVRPGGGGSSGGARFAQPSYQSAATPRYDPLSKGDGLDHIRALQQRISPQPSAAAPSSIGPSSAGDVASGPPPPTTAINQNSRTLERPNGHRAAPPPPSHAATPPTDPAPVVFSPKQAPSPSPFSPKQAPSPVGGLGLDMGDFTTSMFSGTAGSVIDPTPQKPNSIPPAESAAPVASVDPYAYKLGPTVSLPPAGAGRGASLQRRQTSGSIDSSRRQGSIDSVPGIKIDSPEGSTGSNSPSHSKRGRSPPSFGPGDGRSRTASIASGNAPSSLGVQLRSKDSKSVRGSNQVARRSKNLDRNANLDNFTRLSISMTPPSSRKHSHPPDVAPKPSRNTSSSPSFSQEDAQRVGSRDGDDDLHSEYDYDEIDPLEKDWMMASAQADIDGLQRLMMTDPSLLNRKGFLHGYTALHWAAKHGRMDILSMLLIQGALTDIKSTGGLTPLHLAAQAGHDNIVEVLITQHNANINLRENGGRRPIDMLNNKSSEKIKGLLSRLHNHGLPVRVETSSYPASFSRSRESRSSFDRNWKPLGELPYAIGVDKDRGLSRRRQSPKSSIRKTFSFRKNNKIKENITSSPKKQAKKGSRPVSDPAVQRLKVYDA